MTAKRDHIYPEPTLKAQNKGKAMEKGGLYTGSEGLEQGKGHGKRWFIQDGEKVVDQTIQGDKGGNFQHTTTLIVFNNLLIKLSENAVISLKKLK